MRKQRTGNRPGQGRQPTIAPRGKVVTISVRMAQSQKAKYLLLGGAPWLRKVIDTASLPNTASEENRPTMGHHNKE
jgi:hypothetical protein